MEKYARVEIYYGGNLEGTIGVPYDPGDPDVTPRYILLRAATMADERWDELRYRGLRLSADEAEWLLSPAADW